MVEPVEAPHHHHHPVGIPWFDLIMPLAVLAISMASLFASWHSERSMEALVEQNSRLVSAQSTPLLFFDTANQTNGKLVISMNVSNEGTGPAQISWFKLTDAQGIDYSGEVLTERMMRLGHDSGETLTESMRRLGHDQPPGSQRVTHSVIRAGESRLVFSWPKPTADRVLLAEWEKLNIDRFHLKASACYCSIFEECKITDFSDHRPKPVQSCDQASKQPS